MVSTKALGSDIEYPLRSNALSAKSILGGRVALTRFTHHHHPPHQGSHWLGRGDVEPAGLDTLSHGFNLDVSGDKLNGNLVGMQGL